MSSDQSQPNPQSASTLEEIRAARLEKVQQLKQLGMNPYAYRYTSTHHAAELQAKFADLPSGEEVELEVAIAGRILARRVFGKLAFFSLQDETGTIQLYLDKKRIKKAWQILIQTLSTTSNGTDRCGRYSWSQRHN